MLEAGDEVEGLLRAEDEGFGFGFGGCGRRLRFVVSHPFREKLRKGWDTQHLWNARNQMQVLRLRCAALRMTILRTEEAGGAGLGFRAEAVEFDVAENGGLDARKRKEEAGIEVGDGGGTGGLGARRLAGQMELGLDLRKREGHGERVTELGEGVDPGASGIAEAEQLGDLVVGFTGGVVEGAADERVGPGAVSGAAEIEVCVTAGDD